MGVGKGRPWCGRQFAVNDLRNKTLRDLEQVCIGGSFLRRVHGRELTTGLTAGEAAPAQMALSVRQAHALLAQIYSERTP